MASIIFKTCDGQTFPVNLDITNKFGLVRGIFETLGLDENEEQIIPLPKVKGSELSRVLEWIEHHQNGDTAAPEEREENSRELKGTKGLSEWDFAFLGGNPQSLTDLILAADYLDFEELRDVACLTYARLLEGNTPEKLRQMFNISEEESESPADSDSEDQECCANKRVCRN